ncbi:putative secreted protein [[Actinomadura] parvosata subsp. kistnae]|nr:putative secreted protein [Actinomadura parvosata subsp. kistnae]
MQIFNALSAARPIERTRIVAGKAVVMGGSVAGLLAARVLADHAETVVIIERDDLGETRIPRPGVPQGSQSHALLVGGLRQLERWFPGITAQARQEGAVLLPGREVRTYVDNVPQAATAPYDLLSGTRPFLENVIRRRTFDLPNVKVIPGRVTGLGLGGGRVQGVRWISGGEEAVEDADFVVDAMGRASKLGDWLEEAGWQKPSLHRVPINVNYATGLFARSPDAPIFGALARRSPAFAAARTAGGAVSPVEGGAWLVMLGGYDDDRPDRTLDGFLLRCREDLPPAFARAVAGEPLKPIATYRQADARRRDYAGLTRLPGGLVSVGDAVASFNPIYGQGITSATLHASSLSAYLWRTPDARMPAHEFFDLQQVIVDAAWQLSTAADLARQQSGAVLSPQARLARWIGEQIVDASLADETISRRFADVTNMTAHPATLMTPATVARSIWANRRRPAAR